jgi:hypothetical protein
MEMSRILMLKAEVSNIEKPARIAMLS